MRAGVSLPFPVPHHYHHGLVLVSVLVAILASSTALTLALRMRWRRGSSLPPGRIGGAAMGIGIWSMHFVGMLALHLPVDIGYDVWLTLLSMLIAVVVSTFALRIASREQVSGRALIGAGYIAMGIGICAMHYVGMSAIEIDPPIVYDPTAAGRVAVRRDRYSGMEAEQFFYSLLHALAAHQP